MKRLYRTIVVAGALFLFITGGYANDAGLDEKYGALYPPSYIKHYEADREHRIVNSPYFQIGNKDNPLYLDEGETYLWVIDADGNLRIVPETTSPWGKKHEKGIMRPSDGKPKEWGYKEKYGHSSMIGGASGRMAGEIFFENGKWYMNNKSGRYNRRPTRDKKQLQNAIDYFESITPQVKKGSVEMEWLKDYASSKPVTMKDMEEVEYHFNIDLKHAWDGEKKKLDKEFVKKTPFINWRNKVKFKEIYYIDTADRFLKSRNQSLRVRLDVSKVIKSKITQKSRSSDLNRVERLAKSKGEIDVTGDQVNYNMATDINFNFLVFDFYKSRVEDVVNLLKINSWKAYAQITPLVRYGYDRILKTDLIRASQYKGWINTGPHKGQEVEVQIWKKIIDPGKYGKGGKYGKPFVMEIAFDGDYERKKDLDEAYRWLGAELGNNGLLAKEQLFSKAEMAFAVSGRFKEAKTPKTPPVAPVKKIPGLTGLKTRNLDGTYNVVVGNAAAKAMGKNGHTGTVVQTENYKVIVLGAKPSAGTVRAKLIGMDGKSVVLVQAGSALDDAATIRELKRTAGKSRNNAITRIGDSAVAYLEKTIKRNNCKRETRIYYWPGSTNQ